MINPRSLLKQLLHDTLIFCMVMYTLLLAINVIVHQYIEAVFPLHVLGWCTFILILLYVGMFSWKDVVEKIRQN